MTINKAEALEAIKAIGEIVATVAKLKKERDEARAEAARYREALVKIRRIHWPDGKIERSEWGYIAHNALGDEDDSPRRVAALDAKTEGGGDE